MQVIFYSKATLNKAKTAEAGRPIYDDVDMVDVRTGDKHFNPHFPAHEPTVTWDARTATDDRRTWAERFPREYQAYKMDLTPSESGTPLEEWPLLSRAKVSELRAIGIVTVEQIADMSDRHRSTLGAGARQLIGQAQAYVQQAREAAPAMRFAAENAELKDELDATRAELAALREKQKPSTRAKAGPATDDAPGEAAA